MKQKTIKEKLLDFMYFCWVKRKIHTGKKLSLNQEIKLLKHPRACELLSDYIKVYRLSDQAQLELICLPNVSDLLESYIKIRHLCDAAELRLFYTPNAQELIKQYIQVCHFSVHRQSWGQSQKIIKNITHQFDQFINKLST